MTVRELREKLGWTQQQMAHEAGVSMSSLVGWDLGTRTPSMEMQMRLSGLAKANGIDGFAPNCPCCGRPL